MDVNVQNQHVEEALQSAEQEQDADILVIQPVANNDTSSSNNNNNNNNGAAGRVYHGKSSHNTAAHAKQFSTEVDNTGNDDAQYTVLNDAPAGPGTEDRPSPDHVELLAKVDVPGAAPLATAPVPHQLDCWSISSCMLAAQNNYTIDVEQFCPSSGSSLNVSYIVPVSRYLQAVSLELHFR